MQSITSDMEQSCEELVENIGLNYPDCLLPSCCLKTISGSSRTHMYPV